MQASIGNALAILALLPALSALRAASPPVIPVGADAYTMWDRWPYQRIGVRSYLLSTYDRTGGNADASHFLYQVADDFNVTIDVAGPGMLYFVRYNHWHGSPWHYEVDGADHLVGESATADPEHPMPGSVFWPASAFPHPVALTWTETNGADLSWVPIGFTRSFRMAYSRTHYGTGYYIFDRYVGGARLSRPITPWDGRTAPDGAIGRLFARAGSDIAPPAGTDGTVAQEGAFDLKPGEAAPLWSNRAGPSMIRAIEISVPRSAALAFSRARLQATWDGRALPSIDAPIGLFFGAGILYNRDGHEFLVRSLPMVVRYSADRVFLSCFFPMPFFRSAEIRLAGADAAIPAVHWRIRWQPFRGRPEEVGYFHATYRDHPSPEPGRDLVLLDTARTEGSSEWAGQLVGTSLIFSHEANLGTLEGDPRFFFDDSGTPQAQGTGTEEWCGGGDYWGGLNMTLPLVGHPAGARSAKAALGPEDKIESAYRFLLADLMPFGRNARIQLEHGGTDESAEHYETVAYWYGLPAPALVKTDEFSVGDRADERIHRYYSPDASAPYRITSRYEWGPDTLNGKECYPASTDTGRSTKTFSEFRLRLDPDNFGVMLRRKLDYAFPNQRADVFVSDAGPGPPEWRRAGVWYTAGSNTCVYSDPPSELGAARHVLETSNRRFRDDEFLVPVGLTRHRREIRVRIEFSPVRVPLVPGGPLPDLAWSEIRYTCYCYVVPRFRLDPPGKAIPPVKAGGPGRES